MILSVDKFALCFIAPIYFLTFKIPFYLRGKHSCTKSAILNEKLKGTCLCEERQ